MLKLFRKLIKRGYYPSQAAAVVLDMYMGAI